MKSRHAAVHANHAVRWLLALLAIASVGYGIAVSLPASMTAGLDVARQRGRLVVAMDYIAPEYKAGAKFRTLETMDRPLAEDLAKRMRLPLTVVRSADAGTPASGGKADLILTNLTADAEIPPGRAVIPIGYSAGPMAIMRSDTTIHYWEQLKGRKVCVSEGGSHVGIIAARYGAIEMLRPAPADALLSLRTGECDASVHDSTMLEELIKLPEWKKFSARLPALPGRTLAFVVPADDRKTVALLKKTAAEWKAKDYPAQLVKKAVQNIAFEVYLDQNVPDCH